MREQREIISPLNRIIRRVDETALLSFLKDDLQKIGLYDSAVRIFIRPYSKTFEGQYFVKDKKIFLYPFNKKGEYDYKEVFKTLIHEMVHHLQYQNPDFVRVKGVAHNEEFFEIYESYLEKAKERKII